MCVHWNVHCVALTCGICTNKIVDALKGRDVAAA